jgi:hypothetical protein
MPSYIHFTPRKPGRFGAAMEYLVARRALDARGMVDVTMEACGAVRCTRPVRRMCLQKGFARRVFGS